MMWTTKYNSEIVSTFATNILMTLCPLPPFTVFQTFLDPIGLMMCNSIKFGVKKRGQWAKTLGVMRAAVGSMARSSVCIESWTVCSFDFLFQLDCSQSFLNIKIQKWWLPRSQLDFCTWSQKGLDFMLFIYARIIINWFIFKI